MSANFDSTGRHARVANEVSPELTPESDRLDAAFAMADDLLVASLKTDENRRRRRAALILITTGAIIMITIMCLILAGLLGQSGGSVPLDRAATLTQDGWQLWQERKLDDAEAKFKESLKLDPNQAAAWNGLGWADTNQGKVDEAKDAFEHVIKIEPGHAAAENGLGWIAFGKKNYTEAEKHWLVSAKTPDASAAWSGLAQLYLIQGKWDDAEKWAQKLVDGGDASGQQWLAAAKARKLDPKRIDPAAQAPTADGVKKGWVLMNKGNFHQAIDAFTEVLKANPNDADAENGLGWAYLNSGHPGDAKSHFETAVKINPDAFGAINGLAMALKQQGDLDRAIELWKQMIDKSPGVNAATVNLAAVYLDRKEYDKALPLCEQVAAAMPNDPAAQQNLQRARAGAAH